MKYIIYVLIRFYQWVISPVIHTICGPAGGCRFTPSCSHYFLDQFAPRTLARVMDRLDRSLTDGGLWLCSDFAPPDGTAVRRLSQRCLLFGLYRFFGLICRIEAGSLPDLPSAFARLSYRPLAVRRPAAGILWSAAYLKIAQAG
jgi:hypothetical protein